MRKSHVIALSFIAGIAVGIGYLFLAQTYFVGKGDPGRPALAQTPAANPPALSPEPIVATPSAAGVQNSSDTTGYQTLEQRNISIYEEASKGVVHVRTIETTQMFYGFYGDARTQTREAGSGSGIVYDRNGYVLTNFHVVEPVLSYRSRGGSEYSLQVVLWNQASYEARVIGVDPGNDIALLQIDVDADQLHPLMLGSSDHLKVGQQVLAIGNPFGLEGTLTSGIISSLGRSLTATDRTTIENVIQTDAAINPGNSGGPLLNMNGEVIGMNTAILSGGGSTGGNIGIGFAVSAETIQSVVPDLVQYQRVRRPRLHADGGPLSQVLARSPGFRQLWNIPDEISQGFLVLEVPAGSSEAAAGLRPPADQRQVQRSGMFGRYTVVVPYSVDIIIEADGQRVSDVSDIRQALKNKRPGNTMKLKVLRCLEGQECQTVDLNWTLAE